MNNTIIKWKETLFSESNSEFIHPIYALIGSLITIKLRVYKKNPIQRIFVRITPFGGQIIYPMDKIIEEDFFSIFSGRIPLQEKVTNYRFIIETDIETFWYNSKGIVKWNPQDIYDFKFIAEFDKPLWISKEIFYQIFPDRFFDGNPSNNVKTDEYEVHGQSTKAMKWNEIQNINWSNYPSLEFYGGDIEGIKQKIPYLKNLGITSLYLNPIFEAASNHKYDTINYKRIDPHFGTNKEFSDFVKTLHENDMKIMLDAVINHTGEGHHWFNRLGWFEFGAYNSPKDPKRNYYIYYSEDPENYESWLGHKSLPVLNFNSEELKNEIYRNEDSILKYWMKEPYNIDAWRFDVANMLARNRKTHNYLEIWREIRNNLKDLSKDIYLIGEHFFDPSELLDGSTLDGVMNYKNFCSLIRQWLSREISFRTYENERKIDKITLKAKLTSLEVIQQLKEFSSLIPFQILELNFNLLGSHDLPRIFTILNRDVDLYKLAITLLFTFIGIPSIYYGDEIGLEGNYDPDCRRPMIWNEENWNKEINDFYKKIIDIRKSLIELQNGSIKFLYADSETFAFSRFKEDNVTVICVNQAIGEKKVAIPLWKIGVINSNFKDLFAGKSYKILNGILNLTLEKVDYYILRKM
ncbi:MAG: alpha-amylase family glycosyl hydrolase [Candidatus Hodarchaeales archaeon]|jgi:alpha-glucosidase